MAPAACAVIAWAALTCCRPSPALAQPETSASTSVTFAVRFSGGEGGVPAPLRRAVVHLPAGLVVDTRGVGVCTGERLRRRGPSGCPANSLVGRGQALLEARTGSLTTPEEATLRAYRGPNRGSRPTLEIYGHGETPLDESAISTGTLESDQAPYGQKLVVSVPPIPTLVYEPDASLVSMSLTVGRTGRGPRAHAAAGAILVPRSCPAGGFPFAAGFTFADGSGASASATVPCP